MKITFNGSKRKDGKYPVTLTFLGSPNGFGGFYPSKFYNKLLSFDECLQKIELAEQVVNCPVEMKSALKGIE